MKLANMTSMESAGLDKKDLVAILPLGALEQHGKHLPLGVDFHIIQAIAEAVETELAELTVLLPTLWVGHSPHHMKFAGTISIDHQTHSSVLTQTAESLLAHGFEKIIFLNGHGGNGLPMQMALQELKNRYRDRNNSYICAFNYWNIAAQAISEIRESDIGGMGHACEMETSVMQYLYPHLVKDELAEKAGEQPRIPLVKLDMLQGSPVQVVLDFHEISNTGAFGDSTLATLEKGEMFFEAAVRETCKFIADFSAL